MTRLRLQLFVGIAWAVSAVGWLISALADDPVSVGKLVLAVVWAILAVGWIVFVVRPSVRAGER